MLKVQFLGTGTSQGIPVIGSDHPVNFSDNPKDKRLRSSVLLTKNNKNINIDCGPDFRYQMLRAGVKNMEAIIFTHEHNDHVLGIDDTRSLSFYAGKPMELYGNERTLKDIKSRFPYAFVENKYPGAPELELHTLTGEAFEKSGFHIQPLDIMHGKLPIYGFLIDEIFAYITDCSHIPEETMEKIYKVPVLVLGALRKHNPHHSHLTLDQAVELSDKIGAQKTYFTHMSLGIGFHDETQKTLPEGKFLAYDTLEIEI